MLIDDKIIKVDIKASVPMEFVTLEFNKLEKQFVKVSI